METYGNSDIARITGLTKNQIINLSKTKIVKPHIDTPGGTGNRRVYDHENLIEFLICRDLKAAGVTDNAVEMVLNIYRKMLNRENDFVYCNKGNVMIRVDLYSIREEAERGKA